MSFAQSFASKANCGGQMIFWENETLHYRGQETFMCSQTNHQDGRSVLTQGTSYSLF
jgi:hypothetical protein